MPITLGADPESSTTANDYANLAALAASALGDTAYATWTLAQLKEWMLQAFQEYGTHFQRANETTITCLAGTREYNLPTDTWFVLRCEHPTGRTPPAYLTRFNHSRSDFTQEDDRYDWTMDGTQGAGTAKVWISRTPAAGQYIVVLYSGYWYSPASGSYFTRIREAHYPILIQYVVWRAYHERWTHSLLDNLTIAYQEIIDADVPGVKRDAYAFATDRAARFFEAAKEARDTYERLIETAKAQIGKSDTVRWQMGDVDVIY